MEYILIFVAVIALLVAVLMWSRRGQSRIDRESGETAYGRQGQAPDEYRGW